MLNQGHSRYCHCRKPVPPELPRTHTPRVLRCGRSCPFETWRRCDSAGTRHGSRNNGCPEALFLPRPTRIKERCAPVSSSRCRTLRRSPAMPQCPNQAPAHISRNNDDRNLRIFRTIHRAHGNEPGGQVVPECFGERGNLSFTPIRRALNDDDADGALGFQRVARGGVLRELGVVGETLAFLYDGDLPFQIGCVGSGAFDKQHGPRDNTADGPALRNEIRADTELPRTGRHALNSHVVVRAEQGGIHLETLEKTVGRRLKSVLFEYAGDVIGRHVQLARAVAAAFEFLGRDIRHFLPELVHANGIDTGDWPLGCTREKEAGSNKEKEERGGFRPESRGWLRHYAHLLATCSPEPNEELPQACRPSSEYRDLRLQSSSHGAGCRRSIPASPSSSRVRQESRETV